MRTGASARRNSHVLGRSHLSQRGLTIVDTLVILVVGFVLVGIFVLMQPYGLSGGGPSRRTICSSNLKGIGTGFYTYANENKDMWPIPTHALSDKDGVGNVVYAPHKIGVKRAGIAGRPTPPTDSNPAGGGSAITDIELSVTRSLWLLVRTGAATPKSFVCPSSDDVPNDEDNPQDFFDFRKYTEVSYGFQVPFGKNGQPSSNCDQRMPLAADKGPFGFALEMGKPNPGVPNLTAMASPDEWTKWNSPNHSGEGQNVLYADSHVEFQTKPTGGIDNDNIYTRWFGAEGFIKANEKARVQGVPPTGQETPWSETDTLIYP